MAESNWDTKIVIGNREVYSYSDAQKKRHKRLSTRLRDAFGINQVSRYIVVKSLIEQLNNNSSEFKVIRGDITHFFDEVDAKQTMKLVRNKVILTRGEELNLKNIIFDVNIAGLPQGNPVSSVLSEIALKDFDRFVYASIAPAFYARYVDDFVLLFYNDVQNKIEVSKMEKAIAEELEPLGLRLSSEKFKIFNFSDNQEFDFLGYHLKKSNGEVKVTIAVKKLEKIKQKIKKTFAIFDASPKNTSDVFRLKLQIVNLLYGVITFDVYGNKQRSGLWFDYSLINDFSQISNLQRFLFREIRRRKLSLRTRNEIFPVVKGLKSMTQGDSKNAVINYTEMSDMKLIGLIKNLDPNYVRPVLFDKKKIVQRLFSKIYGEK